MSDIKKIIKIVKELLKKNKPELVDKVIEGLNDIEAGLVIGLLNEEEQSIYWKYQVENNIEFKNFIDMCSSICK